MAKEIERKYLVKSDAWKKLNAGKVYRQGYLSVTPERTVRVRTIGDAGFLTIKGKNIGATRMEFEYEIPLDDANEMLDKLCEKPLIEKIRRKIAFGGFTWEVDEFFGENEGLVIVEVELSDENQQPEFPEWIGREVTEDPRYYNANLIKNPYSIWEKNKN